MIKRAVNKRKFAVVKSSNNKTLATTETYRTNQGVQNVAKAIKKVLKNAEIVDTTKKVARVKKSK